MNKKTDFAFGKSIYFLGINEYGENMWIEEPQWDCGWYWGFGYVDTYTNNKNPSKSKNISSHSHFDGLVWKRSDEGVFIYHINEVLKTPFADEESWELSDLMKRFYCLREAAAIFHCGNANYASRTGVDSTDKELAKRINEIELPKIFKRVIEILSV